MYVFDKRDSVKETRGWIQSFGLLDGFQVFLMAFPFFQKGSMDQQDQKHGAWELAVSLGAPHFPWLARGRIDMYACFYVRVQGDALIHIYIVKWYF